MTQSVLEAAIEVARMTGDVALSFYRAHARGERLHVDIKPDGSPVSHADLAAEKAARAFLQRYFPEDGILGEELGATRPEAPRKWCIDPIDGTKSFLAGVPLWGSLVALVEGETVLAGAARFPVTGEAIAAAPGAGCVVEGGRAGVSPVAELGQSLVLTTDERFGDCPECAAPWRSLVGKARLARTWGDCFGYYLVATGRAELMTDGRLSPWDAACFVPIIEEAGGVVTDWDGRRTAFGRGLIATNRAVAGLTREALGVPLAGQP
jgi:histidinol phosphatase-like enzyme (inositol monophosphatase family)